MCLRSQQAVVEASGQGSALGRQEKLIYVFTVKLGTGQAILKNKNPDVVFF
jgi:hypothetical protein